MSILSKNGLIKYKKLLQKKFRNKYKMFIVEGMHLVLEALRTNNVLSIITTKSSKAINFNFKSIEYCSYEQLKQLSTTKTPQDVVAICSFLTSKILDKKIDNKLLLLNNINDPGNLGALIRTACAFNFNNIIVQGVDIYNSKVLRSSQGAIFYTNIFNITNIKKQIINLKNKNYQIIGAVVDKDATHYKKIVLKENFVLILGNEAKGIDVDLMSLLDDKIYIPINFESLNVAITGGILMSEYFNDKK